MRYLIIALLFLCFGCQQENHPKIEVYLLKEKVEFYNGVPIMEANEFKDRDKEIMAMESLKGIRFDTLNKEWIFAGDYDVSAAKLSEKPFITDKEIKGFIQDKNVLVLDSVVTQRILKLKPQMRGEQFVVTIDKKPVLGGYFWNYFSSYWCHSYYIWNKRNYFTEGKTKRISKKPAEALFVLNYGPRKPEYKKKPYPPYPKELIEAFRSSNRLIE